MINDIKKDAQDRMGKSIEALGRHLAAIRTGRATQASWTASKSLPGVAKCR